MSFFTLTFAGFLAGVFFCWWLLPQKARPVLLALANLIFALLLGSKAVLALLLLTLLGSCFGLWLDRKPKRGLLWLGMAACLAPLAAFKYLPMLAPSRFTELLAPLGLSFYTFKSLSYLFEIYRGHLQPARNLTEYFCYVGFFPQLPMGPIQRPQPFFKALHQLPRHLDHTLATNACVRICWALFLKKCLADPFAGHLQCLMKPDFGHSLGILWSLISYSLYLYFDFAAYSGLAIAFGELLGLPCAENFRSPYLSRSIGEFWRRWHISLSSWLKDYIYIPMGGSRNGTAVLIAATMTTFLLSGVWHGSTGGFLLWGGMHGLFLLIGRATKNAREGFWSKTPSFVRGPVRSLCAWGLTMVLVGIGWFFFSTETLPQAMAILADLPDLANFSVLYFKESLTQLYFTPTILIQLALFTFGAFLVDWFSRDTGFGVWSAQLRPWVKVVFCYACLFAVIFFGSAESLDGVYFQF